MERKYKILGSIFLAVALLAGGTVLFLTENLHIPRDRQIVKMIFTDYYDLTGHMVMGEGAAAYEIIIDGYISQDESKGTTAYRFSTGTGGEILSGTLVYPGTPQKQYWRLPRLREGKRYFLIGDAPREGRTVQSFLLFVIQTIDGRDYAYPLLYDDSIIPLTVLGQSEPFRYLSESRIYDRWDDADVLDFLEIRRQANPEYGYKLPLDTLREKYGLLLSKGGR